MIDLENPVYVYWQDGNLECHHVSHEYRHALILDYAKRFELTRFVETGTCSGDTVEAVMGNFENVYSIELSDYYYAKAQDRLRNASNVMLIYGDSRVRLPEILSVITTEPTLFWLDAHCSGGQTVGGIHPVREELEAIFNANSQGVILIDDMQEFWGNGLPALAIKVVAEYPEWEYELKHGIMRIQRRSK